MPTRRTFVIAFLALTLVVVGSVFLVRSRRRPFHPAETPVGAVIGRSIPTYLIVVDRWSRGDVAGTPAELEALREKAVPAEARAALGTDGTLATLQFLSAMTDVARRGAGAEQDNAYVAAGERLNALLGSKGHPYLIDIEVAEARGGRREPLMYSFYVERDAIARVGGADERTLHLWRLDQLNLRQSYLGYTRPRSGVAMVLLDAIETELVVYVLPALAPAEDTELLDEASLDEKAEWQSALRKRAGELVRSHYRAAPGSPLAEVGRLLARRRALVRSWQRTAVALGYRFLVPERLVPEADYHEGLARRVPRRELLEWDGFHDELLSKKNLAAFLSARDEYARSVEQHELQHRADYRRGILPIPGEVSALLGGDPLDAPEGSMRARVRDERSAYLSQIARDEAPSLEIMLLSRFAFDKTQWGGVYTYTALTVLSELARELAMVPVPLVARGAVQRQRVAELLMAILARPASEQRDAAKRAWETGAGAPLPPIATTSVKQHAPWRR